MTNHTLNFIENSQKSNEIFILLKPHIEYIIKNIIKLTKSLHKQDIIVTDDKMFSIILKEFECCNNTPEANFKNIIKSIVETTDYLTEKRLNSVIKIDDDIL